MPGECLSLAIRIEQKDSLTREQLLAMAQPTEQCKFHPSSTQSLVLERVPSVSVPEALRLGRYQSIDSRDLIVSSAPAEVKIDLSGTYYTPVFVRARYQYAWLPIEHCLKTEWRLFPSEMVSLQLAVLGVRRGDTVADMSIAITNNTPDVLTLLLFIKDNEAGIGKGALIFEAREFDLGKYAPQQTKNMYLHARLFEPEISEDVQLVVRDVSSGAERDFTARVHIGPQS